MNAPSRTPIAGGCLLTASILTGVVAGVALHQQSLGFLAGIGVGLLLAGLVWLRDR